MDIVDELKKRVFLDYAINSGIELDYQNNFNKRCLDEITSLRAQVEALSKDAERIGELETLCAEAYIVIGELSSYAGVFENEKVQNILTNLADMKVVHGDILPFDVRKC